VHTVLVDVATFVLRPTPTYRAALALGVSATWLGVLSACFAVAPLILAVPSGWRRDISTADLYDEHGEALDSCDVQFRQYGALTSFTGPAVTVRCHDNVVLRSVLSEPGEGRVLVVDGGGSLHRALIGGLIAGLSPGCPCRTGGLA
jgi:hypothetical protein